MFDIMAALTFFDHVFSLGLSICYLPGFHPRMLNLSTRKFPKLRPG